MVPPTPKMMMAVEGEGGYLKDGAEAFMLFLSVAQLVLWSSSVLTPLDLDEVNVTLENVERFGSMLSQTVWRRWICWWWLAVL